MNSTSDEARTADSGARKTDPNAWQPDPAATPGHPPEGGAPYGLQPAVEARRAADPRRKSPVLAALLSMLPGMGQVYLGEYQLGFVYIMTFAGTVALLSTGHIEGLTPVLGIFLGFFVIYNIIDAARRATAYNFALERAAMGYAELPDDLVKKSSRGSIGGGVLLMVIGFLIFLNIRFDMSMEWLEDWWPLGLIAFGGYLVMEGMKNRNANRKT